MTSRMFSEKDIPLRKKYRKQGKRLDFETKARWIIDTMTVNSQQMYEVTGCRGWGWTMGQIASMVGYARSAAFMNTLFRMCDDGALRSEVRTRRSNGLSNIEYVFYTLTEHAQALKQGKLDL